MKLKEIEFNKNNKSMKFNTRLTFISTFLIIIFYFIPNYFETDLGINSFAAAFFMYFGYFTHSTNYILQQFLYALFVISFIGSIYFFLLCNKFKKIDTKIKKFSIKYLILVFFQLIFSIGLLFFGILSFKKGFNTNPEVMGSPIIHYPYFMIIAIIITSITIFQLIHYLYILKKQFKK